MAPSAAGAVRATATITVAATAGSSDRSHRAARLVGVVPDSRLPSPPPLLGGPRMMIQASTAMAAIVTILIGSDSAEA
ncbi:hypothetical protein GCM10023321_73380 [Pseudonocardia eucalypti]|uniref:Uncharacterized protein n=1 Tax=Pseudonocardia eucalypti TaxID=648755 RepID=A0ABP9R7Z1_9PSEU